MKSEVIWSTGELINERKWLNKLQVQRSDIGLVFKDVKLSRWQLQVEPQWWSRAGKPSNYPTSQTRHTPLWQKQCQQNMQTDTHNLLSRSDDTILKEYEERSRCLHVSASRGHMVSQSLRQWRGNQTRSRRWPLTFDLPPLSGQQKGAFEAEFWRTGQTHRHDD